MKEEEIRKRDVFNKYLRLVTKDTKDFFNFKSFLSQDCPACGGGDFIYEFKKSGFRYVSCRKCSTLFVNPKPPFIALRDFYANSRSTHFWVKDFFAPVAEARRKKIFRPRAKYISTIIKKHNGLLIGDIGAGFGLFLEELRKILPANRYIGIEPSSEMAEICSKKNLEVRRACLEDIKGMGGKFDVLTAFELFEHLFAPKAFLKKAYSLLKPGGYLIITTLNANGFDILLMGSKSKSIFPPHHLNFFNTESIKLLLEDTGFDITKVSTPGKLDWDIVEGAIKTNGLRLGKFWDFIAYKKGAEVKTGLQNWITRNNLSSHMMIIAKKGL